MKIRSGYVSNSSSSSFIIKEFDKNKFVSLIDEFVKTIDFNDELNDIYSASEESVKECIINKLKEDNQDNLKEIYIKEALYDIFYSMIEHHIFKREYEFINCESCSDNGKNICHKCYYDYYRRKSEEYFDDFNDEMNNFKEFNFKNELKEIEKMVYEAEINLVNDSPSLKTDWNKWESIIKGWYEEYYKKWKELNNSAYVLSFASDAGDMTEAFLRCYIYELIKFMRNNGIDGFKGENS